MYDKRYLDDLKTLHRRLLPNEKHAGNFRPPVVPGEAWFAFKPVPLFGNVPVAKVFFSPMTGKWIGRLSEIQKRFLENVPVSFEDAVNRCIEYYLEFDYIHPFADGNGRILKTIVSHQLSKFGFRLNLKQVDSSLLLISTGLAVNRIARHHILADGDQGIETVIPVIDMTETILSQVCRNPADLDFSNVFRSLLAEVPKGMPKPNFN